MKSQTRDSGNFIFESLLEREKVDWLALIAELEDQAINNFVRRYVERFRAKVQNAKVGYFLGRKQHRTENPFFGVFREWHGSRLATILRQYNFDVKTKLQEA